MLPWSSHDRGCRRRSTIEIWSSYTHVRRFACSTILLAALSCYFGHECEENMTAIIHACNGDARNFVYKRVRGRVSRFSFLVSRWNFVRIYRGLSAFAPLLPQDQGCGRRHLRAAESSPRLLSRPLFSQASRQRKIEANINRCFRHSPGRGFPRCFSFVQPRTFVGSDKDRFGFLGFSTTTPRVVGPNFAGGGVNRIEQCGVSLFLCLQVTTETKWNVQNLDETWMLRML